MIKYAVRTKDGLYVYNGLWHKTFHNAMFASEEKALEVARAVDGKVIKLEVKVIDDGTRK